MQVPDFKEASFQFMQENMGNLTLREMIQKAMEHGAAVGIFEASKTCGALLKALEQQRPNEDSLSEAHYLGKL